MSSWFSEKVGNLVRDAPRLATGGTAQRTADELAAELEAQARRITGPQSAAELLTRWVDRSDGGHGAFCLGRVSEGSHGLAEPLSFYQALLRSQALEAFLEACGRAPALRADLLRDGASQAGGGMGSDGTLSFALRQVAERLLLPGAYVLWPSLLEVIVATAGQDELERAKGAATESRCGPWARRALALVKRRWQNEMLPAALRALDRKLSVLSIKQTAEDADAQADLLRSTAAGQRMSKGGIRAALARERLKRCSAEATRLRARTELLCDACARLEAADGGATSVPEAERLLGDADEMLVALDDGVKELSLQQDVLRQALNEAASLLETQIAESRETLGSFSEKRSQLQEERALLMRRLEEVTMQLAQIDEATTACEQQTRQLTTQLRDATQHFEEKIASSFSRQKRLADEKLRAVACKECGHSAVDIIRSEERRRSAELAVQLRRRRAELRRECAAYLHQERLRVDAAAECLAGQDAQAAQARARGEEAGDPAVASAAVQEAWQNSQAVLKRALLLLRTSDLDNLAAGASAEGSSGSAVAASAQDPATEDPPEDAIAFFAQEAQRGQGCIDCGLPDADWASVSFGTYLCVDCAGKHRGLGVHLSFVRSTTMDVWSQAQLRRMQLGGTSRFREFLAAYPRLRDPPQTPSALATRYKSRAAAYYRKLLDTRCEGGDPTALRAPPPEEGFLPAASSGSTDDSVAGRPARGSAAAEGEEGETAVGSLEEEQAALEAAVLRCRQQSQDPARTVQSQSQAAPVAGTLLGLAPPRAAPAPEVSALDAEAPAVRAAALLSTLASGPALPAVAASLAGVFLHDDTDPASGGI